MERSLPEKHETPPLLDRLEHRYAPRDLVLDSTKEARDLLSYENAVRMRVLPLAIVHRGGSARLRCALAERSDEAIRALHFLTDLEPECCLCDGQLIDEAIVKAYRRDEQGISSTIRRLVQAASAAPPIGTPSGRSVAPQATGDAAQFLQDVFEFAVARGASDLHLCPSSQGAFLRLRIDGELLTQEQHHYPSATHEQMVSRLKVLAGLDISCKGLPQDGACSIRVGNTAKSVRLSMLPTVHGESVAIRFLYARKLPRLSTIGMEPTTLALVQRAIDRTSGVVLLTGPTGSGKTTTMYSLALELQHRGRNVVTVEDPVEAPIPGMVQVQVREAQGLDYPRAIRSVLRHDPDVILIGEMRDPTSAKIAISAALTGHLTISSLHMGSALQALDRLRSFDLPARECAQGISLVLNQRLLPRLCQRCRVIDEGGTARLQRVLYQPLGCPSCEESGFDGRVLLTEALDLLSLGAKEAYTRAETVREALIALPSGAFVPWTRALEYHLNQGHLSAQQVQEFLDGEISLD